MVFPHVHQQSFRTSNYIIDGITVSGSAKQRPVSSIPQNWEPASGATYENGLYARFGQDSVLAVIHEQNPSIDIQVCDGVSIGSEVATFLAIEQLSQISRQNTLDNNLTFPFHLPPEELRNFIVTNQAFLLGLQNQYLQKRFKGEVVGVATIFSSLLEVDEQLLLIASTIGDPAIMLGRRMQRDDEIEDMKVVTETSMKDPKTVYAINSLGEPYEIASTIINLSDLLTSSVSELLLIFTTDFLAFGIDNAYSHAMQERYLRVMPYLAKSFWKNEKDSNLIFALTMSEILDSLNSRITRPTGNGYDDSVLLTLSIRKRDRIGKTPDFRL